LEDTVNQIPLPADQLEAFAKVCRRDGLHPDGFDIKAFQGQGADALEILVTVGKREYRYPVTFHDYSWIETFFAAIRRVGDAGDGV
jgi:hypothetical protein